MAAKNNLTFNQDNDKAISSGFVVDLRSTAKAVSEALVSDTAGVIAKKVRRIKPNLLHESSSRSGNFFNPRIFNIFQRRKKFSWRKFFRFNIKRAKKINHGWRHWVAEQSRIFSRPIQIGKLWHQQAESLKRERKRADEAEEKLSWYRSLLSFVIVLILLIVPIKILSYFELFDIKGLENKIMNSSQLALNSLMAAADSVAELDFKQADSDFQAAGENFLAAQEDLGKISDGLLAIAALSNDPKMKLAAESKKFLTAGALASSLGSNLVLATDSLFNGDKDNFSANLDNFLRYGHLAVADAQALKKDLAKINTDNLPAAYQEKFATLTQEAGFLADSLAGFVSSGDKLKEILGLSRDKRYLLVFQNNAELRASGGFLGSYALVDLRDGKIRNLEVPGGGSYDTEAGMKDFRVVAPEPLWLVNPLWHFWDANWWPDWPTTAKNLMWFYEKSDGPSVDGVIGLTPTVVEGLLEITGPIDLSQEYGLIIDADNFWETVQTIVEQKNLAQTNPETIIGLRATSAPIVADIPLEQGLEVNSENKPKKIIGDLMAKILEILPKKLNKDNLLQIMTLFENSMSEKQILFYFTDPELQAEFSSRNFSGEVRSTERDYLMVVNTNIAGQKSDRLMNETIEQESEVKEDGTIINTVRIIRTHEGIKRAPLTGVRNVDWLRVYVPRGSELLSASGFSVPDAQYFDEQPDESWTHSPLLKNEEAAVIDDATGVKIYTENDKTVFANWVMVDPGETAVITLQYRLPFNFFSATSQGDGWLAKVNNWLNPEDDKLISYSLLVQKQPGAKPSLFSSRLVLLNSRQVFWRYPENLIGQKGWQIDDKLDSDKYWSILVK